MPGEEPRHAAVDNAAAVTRFDVESGLPGVMKEILIYLVVAVSGLLVMSYSVHMLVGGLVSPETEYMLIDATILIGVTAIAFMAWDVIQRRKGRK